MATNDKYDRQLRLWGAKGQRALGETCVVLVGASAAGTETLKNLVLPGVGSFVVVDDAAVTQQDIQSNFFIVGDTSTTSNGGGKRSRAEVASHHLQELNPDVQGGHENVDDLGQVDWKSLFDSKLQGANVKNLLVLASDLIPCILTKLSQSCTDSKLPLVVVQSYGLIGLVRLQVTGNVALLDPKPTNSPPDLRIKTSFAALNDMSDSINLTSLEDHIHGHVPYPIILHKCLQEWKSSHDDKCPSNFNEKQEFKDLIKSKSRDINKELNFEEAISNAYLAYTERDLFIPEGLDSESTLAKLYAALTEFQNRHGGRAPVNGSIPDMTANTDLYVQLQKIYKDQADADLKEMKSLCGAEGIEETDVESFCANVFSVAQLSTRSLMDEFDGVNASEELIDDWKMTLMDPYEVPEHTPIYWYLGLRACQMFCLQHQRWPGTIDNWESDIPLLQEFANQVLTKYQLHDDNQTFMPNIIRELTRYANAEIHNIASVVGGVASQEAVKLITGQYIPLDNTYVFNGIVGVGGVYKF